VCFLTLLSAASGQEPPPATSQQGAFAFPDATGTRLLADSTLPQPSAIRTALCTGGRRFRVRFLRRQAERPGHNGRQTAANFDRLRGNVFAIAQGRVEDGATCFLAAENLSSSATLLAPKPPDTPSECAPDLLRRLASSRNRQVAHCWNLADLPAAKQLVLVEFVRHEKDALASVVLVERDRTIFADYPAVVRGGQADLWRADDGGVLSAGSFHVVFLLERGTFHALGISWSASEGTSLALFVSNGGDQFTRVIGDYWYRAPV